MGAIDNLPAALANAVQNGILARECMEALKPLLMWDLLCTSSKHEGNVGTTVTMTRAGLIAPSTPASALLTPAVDPGTLTRSQEQFSYTVLPYGKSLASYLPNDRIAAFNMFEQDYKALVFQGKQSLNRARRDAVLAVYEGGNSYATTGATSTSLVVADATGFDTVLVNGTPTAVSSSNHGTLSLGGVSYEYTGVSGNTITLASSQTWSQYDSVVRSDAPKIIRPAGISTDHEIVSTSLPTLEMFRHAAAFLKSRGVPGINGTAFYGAFISPEWENVLLADREARNRLLAADIPEILKTNALAMYGGVIFYVMSSIEMKTVTTSDIASLQTTMGVALVFGDGVLEEKFVPEAEFANGATVGQGIELAQHYKLPLDPMGILTYVLRSPQDALGHTVLHSWAATVGYAAPTDRFNLTGVERAKRACALHAAQPSL